MKDEFEEFAEDLVGSGVRTRKAYEIQRMEAALKEVERQKQRRAEEKEAHAMKIAQMKEMFELHEEQARKLKEREDDLQRQRAKEKEAFDREVKQMKEKLEQLENQNQMQGERTHQSQSTAADEATNAAAPGVVEIMAALGGVLQTQTRALLEVQESARAMREDNGVRQNYIVPDIQNTIRDFVGTEGPESAKSWVSELENLKNIHSWPDPVAFSVGKAHLKNAAFKWFLTRVDTAVDYDSLVTAFKATFTTTRSRSERIKSMMTRLQKPKEAVQEYLLDKVWLCQGLDLTCAEIRDEVAEGLWHRELANFI